VADQHGVGVPHEEPSSELSGFWADWLAHELTIRRYCARIATTETDAEDLYGMTMLRAYEKYHLYNPAKANFATWCYHIARSVYLNHFARRARVETLVPEVERVRRR